MVSDNVLHQDCSEHILSITNISTLGHLHYDLCISNAFSDWYKCDEPVSAVEYIHLVRPQLHTISLIQLLHKYIPLIFGRLVVIFLKSN